MKILIVVGAGEVGRYLIKDFSQQGHNVTVLDRATKPPEVEENGLSNRKTCCIREDI